MDEVGRGKACWANAFINNLKVFPKNDKLKQDFKSLENGDKTKIGEKELIYKEV